MSEIIGCKIKNKDFTQDIFYFLIHDYEILGKIIILSMHFEDLKMSSI